MSEGCTHDCSTCSSKCSEKDLRVPCGQFSNVKKVIGVVSGKGGVGKSLVTSLLASAMQARGHATAIMDADVTGPSIPKSFGLHGNAVGDERGLLPMESKTGIKIMSVNLLLEKDDAFLKRHRTFSQRCGSRKIWLTVAYISDIINEKKRIGEYLFVRFSENKGGIRCDDRTGEQIACTISKSRAGAQSNAAASNAAFAAGFRLRSSVYQAGRSQRAGRGRQQDTQFGVSAGRCAGTGQENHFGVRSDPVEPLFAVCGCLLSSGTALCAGTQ